MNENLDNDMAALPPQLLNAVSSPGGGRIALVLGAGCSTEEPTCLPLSGDLAEECNRKLVADGILDKDEVEDCRDLSAIAEAVVNKTGSQRDLVERFPPDTFRNAQPNEGYLIMAALLLEGALSNTLTLNFDTAARTALANLGTGPLVSTIRGPADHTRLGTRNLIYLHRDIDSDPDQLVLRSEDLEMAWRDHWEEVVTNQALAGPITVFVGLGSPASVLVDTTKRIRTAIGEQASVYVVDPTAYEDSHFASELEICSDAYFRMGWGEFMQALSQRVVEEHRAAIERDCEELIEELDRREEDVSDICRRLADLGLLRLGQLRAAWMLKGGSYLPHESDTPLHLFSSLVIGVLMVERVSGHQAGFAQDGLVEFSRDSHLTRVIVCSGGGWMTDARMETKLRKRQQELRQQGIPTSVALVGGVEFNPNIAAPSDIIVDESPHDLVTGPEYLKIVSIAQLRADPELAYEVVR